MEVVDGNATIYSECCVLSAGLGYIEAVASIDVASSVSAGGIAAITSQMKRGGYASVSAVGVAAAFITAKTDGVAAFSVEGQAVNTSASCLLTGKASVSGEGSSIAAATGFAEGQALVFAGGTGVIAATVDITSACFAIGQGVTLVRGTARIKAKSEAVGVPYMSITIEGRSSLFAVSAVVAAGAASIDGYMKLVGASGGTVGGLAGEHLRSGF